MVTPFASTTGNRPPASPINSFLIPAKSEMVLVPETALVKQGQLTGIYTIGTGNVAILRWLRIGKTFGNQVEVLSGLSVNEQYIVSAEGKLYNGVLVSIQ